MPKLLLNGRLATIDQQDYASFHGNSVFTTLRSRNKEALLWSKHWQRLSTQARYFGFLVPAEELIITLILQALSLAKCDQKIRVILSAHDFALSFEDYNPPMPSIYKGISTCISQQKLHPDYKRFKTGNSLPYVLAHQEASSQGVFEALLLDQDGYVVDGSRTSIMHFDGMTMQGLLGGLDGIMRECALEFARQRGIDVRMCFMKPNELTGQILIANCLIGVVPVGNVDHPFIQELVNYFQMSV